jgi:glutaminyl-peptide cyclotransferase
MRITAPRSVATLKSAVRILGTGLVLCACAPAAPPEFDGKLAKTQVETQVAFGPRIPGTVGHSRCGDWLADELSRHTEAVRRQVFYHVGPDSADSSPDTMHLTNLIASFRPELSKRLTICAHWDSRPRSDEDKDTANHSLPCPGANDGASGVAVCLELARLMAAAPPPIGVDLLLFDAEDQGARGDVGEYLIGSRWFVSQAHGYRPMAVILLDMIGDAQLNISREAYSDSLAPALTDLIWQTASSLGLSGFVDTVGYHVIDDHLPFLLNGIPAVDLIDFDYPPWHTVADTPDKVSSESLAEIGRLLVAIIYHTPVETLEQAARKRSR